MLKAQGPHSWASPKLRPLPQALPTKLWEWEEGFRAPPNPTQSLFPKGATLWEIVRKRKEKNAPPAPPPSSPRGFLESGFSPGSRLLPFLDTPSQPPPGRGAPRTGSRLPPLPPQSTSRPPPSGR